MQEENADPSSSVTSSGPQPQECNGTEREERETGNTFVSPQHFRMDVSFLSPVT